MLPGAFFCPFAPKVLCFFLHSIVSLPFLCQKLTLDTTIAKESCESQKYLVLLVPDALLQ